MQPYPIFCLRKTERNSWLAGEKVLTIVEIASVIAGAGGTALQFLRVPSTVMYRVKIQRW